jgi:hypothetical protein
VTPEAEDENHSDRSSINKYKIEPSNFYTDDKEVFPIKIQDHTPIQSFRREMSSKKKIEGIN